MQSNLYTTIHSTDCLTDTGRIRKLATEVVCALAERMGWLTADQWLSMNQKGRLHALRMVQFAANGDLSFLDVLTAGMVCALMVNDEGTRAKFDSVTFAFSGIGTDDTKPFPKIGSRAIQLAFGHKSQTTARTQTSRTVGKRGLLTQLGATVPDAHGLTVANKAHPFVRAIAGRLASVNERALCQKLGVDPVTGDLTQSATE